MKTSAPQGRSQAKSAGGCAPFSRQPRDTAAGLEPTVGTILAGLNRTEVLVAVNGRDRLVRVELVPGLRVGDHVLVREARVVARITSTEAAAIEAVLDRSRGAQADDRPADG